jgi:hypothetical protein
LTQTLPDSKSSESAPPVRRNLVVVSRKREPFVVTRLLRSRGILPANGRTFARSPFSTAAD